MKFMKSKEIAVSQSHTENRVTLKTDITTKQKLKHILLSYGLTVGSLPAICFGATFLGELIGDPMNPASWWIVLGGTFIMAPMGRGISKGASYDLQNKKLKELLNGTYQLGYTDKEIDDIVILHQKTPRILMGSFHIREASEMTIEDIYTNNRVPKENSTHEVRHYLVRDGKNYTFEQEVIPNDETIWDLSANALAEVYGVQEKTDSMKEVTA